MIVTLSSALVRDIWHVVFSSGLPVQERQTSWRESNEGLLDDKGASLLQGQAGSNETTAWTVQPGGESINMYKYLIGGVKTASTS